MNLSIKKNKLIIISAVLYLLLLIFRRDLFYKASMSTLAFIKEMLQVLPPVLVISALITVWVPSEIIRKSLGANSGVKGRALSFLVGSLSAGPIYAAFPAVLVLFKKGASISNLVIILSSWAVIKIPMLLVESSFLGPKFTIIRLLLTVPTIYLMGLLTQRFVQRDEIVSEGDKGILTSLPNLNCGLCGYKSCIEFANSVKSNINIVENCLIIKRSVKDDI